MTGSWIGANLILVQILSKIGSAGASTGIVIKNSANAMLALNSIRTRIDNGQFSADGRLPAERELSVSLCVSRRAVQRALEVLETEGIVWRQQGKGTFAGQPPDPNKSLAAKVVSETDPIAVMEARMAIEPALAALCARRATADDVAKLHHLAKRTAGSADSESIELWDGALHHCIATVAGNRLLMAAFTLLDHVRSDKTWQSQRHRARSPGNVNIYYNQHCVIIDAIAARDGNAARSAMSEHLELLLENLLSAAPKLQQ